MALSITTRLIMEAARRRDWQAELLDEATDLYAITTSSKQIYYIRNILSHRGSGSGAFLAKHKNLLSAVVAQHKLALLPAQQNYSNTVNAEAFLKVHKRVVVKPTDQSHGDGVTIDVDSPQKLHSAIKKAQAFNGKILIQQQILGDDYRLLFMGDKLVAAAIREPAAVIGDGQHTIAELIELENKNPERGPGYEKRKTFISLIAASEYLGNGLHNVPSKGQKTPVVGIANIGKGGVALDVTDTLDKHLVAQALKLKQHFKIEVCGLDYIIDNSGQAYFIEINTTPSLGLHEYPASGKARQTPEAYLDWLTAST